MQGALLVESDTENFEQDPREADRRAGDENHQTRIDDIPEVSASHVPKLDLDLKHSTA